MFRQFIIILLTIFSGLVWGQRAQKDFEKELKEQNSAIQSLRNEIEATKKRIQSEGKKEKSSARRVSNLSEEISLLQRLLKEIDKEEKLLVADISRTEKQIKKSETELEYESFFRNTLDLEEELKNITKLATMIFLANNKFSICA